MPTLDPIAIDALLPQTQCAQCGYDGCFPYARAIASGDASINRCAPGGDEGIRALADLTGLRFAPLDPAHGVHKPRVLAVIDEARCIGCTICIQKCPVDAIAGAAKLMHTVLADECTGCELCVAPCPVDCIALVSMPDAHPAIAAPDAAKSVARDRHRARIARVARDAIRAEQRRSGFGANRAKRDAAATMRVSTIIATADASTPIAAGASAPIAATGASMAESAPVVGSDAHKRDAVAAALARARARREGIAKP